MNAIQTLTSRSTQLVLNGATARLDDFMTVVTLAVGGYTNLAPEESIKHLSAKLTPHFLPILRHKVFAIFYVSNDCGRLSGFRN